MTNYVKSDLNDHYIWWNASFVQMEAGLMEIVRSLNINWIYDTYFSLYRAIHTWEKSGGNCTGGISGYPLQRRWTQTLILSMFSSLIPKQDVSATPFERHTFSRQHFERAEALV